MKQSAIQKKNEGQKEEKYCVKKFGAKTYFDCECGKRYDNFPALYLHFQRKHGRKISTKLDNESYEAHEEGKIKILTYLIRENSSLPGSINRKQSLSLPQSSFSFLLQEFSFQNPHQHCGLDRYKYVYYLKVASELLEEVFRDVNEAVPDKIKNIPLFLNEIYFKAIGKSINIDEAECFCAFLLLFVSWLKKKKYTEYAVEYVGLQTLNSSILLE